MRLQCLNQNANFLESLYTDVAWLADLYGHCRMAKESAPAKGSTAQPLRFNDKHSYTQPSAKELLAGERPLQPTPEVSHSPRVVAAGRKLQDCRIKQNHAVAMIVFIEYDEAGCDRKAKYCA